MDFWIQIRVSPQQHDKMDLVGNMYSGTWAHLQHEYHIANFEFCVHIKFDVQLDQEMRMSWCR